MLERIYCALGFLLWLAWYVGFVVFVHHPVTLRGKPIWRD